MTLTQLRCFCEVVNCGLNLSRAAAALHTSQPAVTKMIRGLESELGVQLLFRHGPRITGMTPHGQALLDHARRVIDGVTNLRVAAADLSSSAPAALRIGTTHLHAKYALVDVVRRFVAKHPEIDLSLYEGTPTQVTTWVASGEIDLGLCTEPSSVPKGVLSLEAYPVHRCIVAPRRHPILRLQRPALSDIARYRFIAYDRRFRTGRVEATFDAASLHPRIVMRATDADTIKAYVAAGLGIAVIQEMALNRSVDRSIGHRNADHLFPMSPACIVLRRDSYLSKCLYDFAAMLAPAWTKQKIDLIRSR